MSIWFDFAAIKRSVPLALVLERYHVALRRSGHDQYRRRCPIHRGGGGEALHANLSRNIFHCFSCGAGGSVLDFVAAIERCSLPDAAWRLQEAGLVSVQPAALAQPGRPLVTKKRIALTPLGFTLRGIDSTHAYLSVWGIDAYTAEQFGIGFYSGPGIFSGRLVIPIHNQHGDLVAYCGRAVDGSEPRYRFPSGFAKSEVLFNFHRAAAAAKPAVVVVEGFFDCFKLYQAGVRSVVALMGSALYERPQRLLLQQFQTVILMWDGDAAGRRATAEIAARLQAHRSILVIDVPPDVQPDRMNTDQIRQILRTGSANQRADSTELQ